MQCPNCGAVAPDDVRYCENCGANLQTKFGDAAAASNAGTCRCGAGIEARDEHGYCTVCGRRWQAPGRDHVSLPLAPHFAAVTDRGLRHPRNEDDVTLAMKETNGQKMYVITVCDGVSSSQIPDTASAMAASAAEKSLLQSLEASDGDLKASVVEAILAGNRAVCELPYTPGGSKSPPSTTIVTAVVRNGAAVVGWVGDSRAYLIGSDESRLLTHDDSWVNQVVDAGEMTEEEAMQAPNAHAITQCLGLVGDGEPEQPPQPNVIECEFSAGRTLLVCTDGLWNYAGNPEHLAEFVNQSASADAVDKCAEMVRFALDQGGRDNVTVALLSL
jgi:serine/threonine protein phosphatase PrpC